MRTAVDPPGLGGAPSDLPAGPAGLDVDALRARAEDAVREGNLGAAERLLRRALVISKGAGEDLVRLGRVLEAKGALDAAAECFSEATKADPDAALPARALARVSMALGEFETAGACLSRLLVAVRKARQREEHQDQRRDHDLRHGAGVYPSPKTRTNVGPTSPLIR